MRAQTWAVTVVAAAFTAGASVARAGEVLIVLDFQDVSKIASAKTTQTPGKPNERATGVILRPLYDNSEWFDVWTKYSIESRDGVPFQRIQVVRISTDRNANSCGQVVCDLPDIGGTNRYTLHIKLRSPDGAALRLGLRQRSSPYAYYWDKTLTPTEEWQDFTFEITAKVPGNTEVGLYLKMPKTGTVDIAALRLEKK